MKPRTPQHRVLALTLVAMIAAVALIGSVAAGRAGASAKHASKTYPREKTLITYGTQWGDIAGFNPYGDNYAVGTVGLCYETLLRYDPLAGRYINWLAKSARFTGPKTFTVVLRPGIKWGDGKPFTAQDVAWNFRLGRFVTAFWNNLYLNLKSIETPLAKRLVPKKRAVWTRDRVVFTFRRTPNYAQWQNLLWNLPMISPAQAKGRIQSPTDLLAFSPIDPIGTGPYKLDPEGYDPTTRVVWKKKAVWWAAKQGIAPSPKPPYVIDLVSGICNACDLSGVLTGIEDLNNIYLPGIQELANRGLVQTYYSRPPYDLTANTTWLTPNTTHKPLDDPVFRRALATSINVSQIVSNDYRNLVLPASPTGLLPIWKRWINTSLVAAKGFSFSTSGAISMLRAAGYSDASGWFANKDGSPISLKIAVPSGWSDWEAARDMIVADAAAAHIKLTTSTLGYFDDYRRARNSGEFDLVIDSTPQISDNPWTYFNFLFHLPIITTGPGQTFANFSRYANATAWARLQQLDKTPLGNTKARKRLIDDLEAIQLDDLPNIPLWYNGLWSQSQSHNWTNWPSSTSSRKYVPTMWRGYMQMTGIDMITHLKRS